MKHLRDLLVSWGPAGLFVVSLVENAGPPSPGGTDIVLLILAAARPAQAMLCAAVALAAALIGSALFFEIMHRGGEKVLAKYASREKNARLHHWAARYGLATVFICALVPLPGLPYKFFAACASAMGVSRTRFLTTIALARTPRFLGLAYLGSRVGQDSGAWLKAHFWDLFALAALLGAALLIWARVTERREMEGQG